MTDDPFPSLTSKRQRHDDPGDALNVEPPAKISKTSPGPMRHHREESTNLANPDTAADELEKNVIESIKHTNTIAICPPRSITRLTKDFLSWTCEDQNLHGSMSVAIVNDDAATESYRDWAKNFQSISKVYLAPEKEHTVTRFDSTDNTGKAVLFTSSQEFPGMLSCGSLSIAQISALVICDASILIEKGRSLAKVMADCCSPAAPFPRPRVLILIPTTQLDIVSNSDVVELKTAFAAALLGAPHPAAETPALRGPPVELVIAYDRSEDEQETLLCQKLRECHAGSIHLNRYFRNASLALRDLGPCAADLVWREAFSLIDANKESVSNDEYTQACDVIRHWPFKLPNLDITSRNMNVSHKFFRLVQLLESFQTYGDKFRGIVFVQKRIIAQLVVALIHNLMPPLQFLRPVAITNHRLSSDHNTLETLSHQLASGQYNLIVATKSFEDVGFSEVPVVIMFDVFESQVSRAYARSCASGSESRLIHMVEHQNNIHRHALSRTAFDTDMLQWADAMKCDSCCGVTPPRILRETNAPYDSDSEDEDSEFIQDPVTGSRLHKHQATQIFLSFAARAVMQGSIPRNKPLFNYEPCEDNNIHNKWRCTLSLPGTLVDGLSGPAAPSKPLARRETCYAACQQLQHLAQLDSRTLPLDETRNNEVQDDAPDAQPDPVHEQPYIPMSPVFWPNSISNPTCPRFLYPWAVSTIFPGSGLEERAPLCILTRAPLPDLPTFAVSYFGNSITLQFHRAPPLELDPQRLELVHKFTVKFCRIIMNKPFESSTRQEMGYFFVPLDRKWRPPKEVDWASSLSTLLDDIDWTTATLVSETWAVPLADSSCLESDLEDAVVQDRTVEFTHRCEITRIRTDMTPLSEVDNKPLGYSLLKHAAFVTDERFEQGGKTLLEKCHNRRKIFEGLRDPNQPILEVTRIPAATNCLNPRIPSHTEESEKAIQLLIPEFSRKLTIPASTLRMGSLLPSVMRRVDEFLLVKQLNAKILCHCVKDDLLMAATASPLAGNDYDYERLELLGDSFLKYLSSIYVFVQNPDGAEGELHTARQMYISNQQLCRAANRVGLPGYIQLKPFSIKAWIPPGMEIGDNQKKQVPVDRENQPQDSVVTPQSQSIANSSAKRPQTNRSKNQKKRPKKNTSFSPIATKTIADVAEAIIGAAYISGGRETALRATKALGIPFIEIEEWSDFNLKAAVAHRNRAGGLEASVKKSIEQIIGHTFRNSHLLALALIHTTFNNVEMKGHQRLEFIGDAVLDFLVVRYLYDKNQQASPGDLSLSKSIMVSNSTLAAICVWSGLHKFIHTTQQLGRVIQDYEKALAVQRDAQCTQAGKEEGPVERYWKNLDAPKALSDVVESMIGAVFISDNFSQTGVETIFHNILQPFYEKYIVP